MVTLEEMTKIMEEIPPSDPEMFEDIHFNILHGGYLIYDGKKNRAVCTRCGYEWDIAPGEYSHMSGRKDICPQCELTLTCLSAGRGRQKYSEYHRMLSFAEKDGTLWAVLNEVIPDFRNFGRPHLLCKTTAVYKFSRDEQKYWHRMEQWYGEDYFAEPKEIKLPTPTGSIYGWSRWEDHVYIHGLEDMILRSDAKYLFDNRELIYDDKLDLTRFIAVQLRWHSVELLRKAGFTNIANIKIMGYGGARCVNWRADSLEKILKLPRRWVRFLQPYNPSVAELEVFQHMTEEEKRAASWDTIEDIARGYRSEKAYRKEVEDYMPFLRWLRYTSKQKMRSKRHLLTDYLDYIRTAEKLGLDITKNRIRCPEDLQAAHDDIMARWKVAKDEALERAITAKARMVEDYRIGDLTILPALTQEDLNKESAGLCHCVKTYGDKIARGSCWIFFIRDVHAVSKPYYTLETTTDGKMVQCRGMHNCNMTDEVKAFVDKFVSDLQKQVKAERSLICQTA